MSVAIVSCHYAYDVDSGLSPHSLWVTSPTNAEVGGAGQAGMADGARIILHETSATSTATRPGAIQRHPFSPLSQAPYDQYNRTQILQEFF